MPARVWEGTTASGVPVVAFITRVAVNEGLDAGCYDAFKRDLLECVAQSAEVVAFPSRLIV